MPLILLRHTRPLGCDGLCYGRHDPPLPPSFPAEAEALEARLPPVAAIATSPLGRARRLAEAIAAARGLVAAIDPRLAEIDFGRWEGLPWDAVPRAELDAWAADLVDARPHGGESVAALKARVAEALAAWGGRPGRALLVTHAGVIRAARAISGHADPWTSRTGYGDWIVL